jgi:hypothetical protein
VHHAILKDYLASNLTPTMTAAEYFPNFMLLHDATLGLHGPQPSSNGLTKQRNV